MFFRMGPSTVASTVTSTLHPRLVCAAAAIIVALVLLVLVSADTRPPLLGPSNAPVTALLDLTSPSGSVLYTASPNPALRTGVAKGGVGPDGISPAPAGAPSSSPRKRATQRPTSTAAIAHNESLDAWAGLVRASATGLATAAQDLRTRHDAVFRASATPLAVPDPPTSPAGATPTATAMQQSRPGAGNAPLNSPAPRTSTLSSTSSSTESRRASWTMSCTSTQNASVRSVKAKVPRASSNASAVTPSSTEQATMTMPPIPSPVTNISVNAALVTGPPCAGPCRLCLARTEVVIKAEATLECPTPDPVQPCMHWLLVRAGLGNRMRAVVSYLAAARYMGCHLTVFWHGNRERETNVLFGDLFELPAAPDLHVMSCIDDGCKAIAPDLQRIPEDAPDTYHIHPQTHRIFPLLGPLVLQIFRPLPHILARVAELLTTLGPSFTALHIRRTDKNGGYVHDAEYAAWTTSFPDEKVFAAVDNALSLSNVKGALDPGRVIAQENFVKVITRAGKKEHAGSSERHTTLADAIVDMWTASFSAHFHGTRASSFSVLIQLMRTARNSVGALGVDAWDDNCADTDAYPRLSPPPPWIQEPAAWPTALTFSTVAQSFKLDGDKCRKYAKKKIKQPPQNR